MATLRQYFETDFAHAVKIHVNFPVSDQEEIEALWLVDFIGYMSFLSCYVPGVGRSLDYYLNIIRALEYGRTTLTFRHKIALPLARWFPGALQIENKDDLAVHAQFFGDPLLVSAKDVQMSKHIFIYSESQLSDPNVITLKAEGRALGHEIQFRSRVHATMRSKQEEPKAFISYDSRDRPVAQAIATGLQRLMCLYGTMNFR